MNVAQNVLVSGKDAERWGNAHPNLVPYQLFDAADRSFVIAVGSDAQWRACATALGLTELAKDPALTTNAGRVGNRERWSRLCPRESGNGRRALDRAASSAGVPCGLVQDRCGSARGR